MVIAKLKAWLYTVALGALALFGLLAYRSGRKDAINDIREDDYENAEDIRRRVSVDRADRVRKLDDAGFRD